MKNILKNKFVPLTILSILILFSCKNQSDELEKKNQERYDKSTYLIREASDRYRTGNYSEAKKLFEEAVEIAPENDQAYSNRGYFKQEYSKDYAGAVADYTRSIEILNSKGQENDFKAWGCYNSRAETKQLLGDNRGALQDFNKAIELRPTIGSAYISRGLLKYNFFNDQDGACADWSKAGELGKNDAYDYINEYCN